MMYAGRVLAALALVAVSVGALPNHLKAVVVDTDPKEVAAAVPSVSASFGPYSASAGVGAGGLYAGADSPHGAAAAGLGAAGAGAGAEAAGPGGGPPPPPPPHKPAKPVHGGGNLFDNIFNIPISVLQAVNTYLNNRELVVKPGYPHHRRRGQEPYKNHAAPAAPGAPDVPHAATASPGATDATDAAPAAPTAPAAPIGGPAPAGPYVQKRVNYDNIFNIPIAALKSVNNLLNGGYTGTHSSSSASSSHPH